MQESAGEGDARVSKRRMEWGHAKKSRFVSHFFSDLPRTTTSFVHPAIGMGTTAIAWEAARARTARERVIFIMEL